MQSQIRRYLSFRRSTHQMHALDGLRAMAVVLVLFRHGFKLVDFEALLGAGASPLVDVWAVLFHGGWMGVDLFFVLSGFLIGGQLLRFLDSGRPTHRLWRFYLNRFFRIIPPYFALLLFIQLVAVQHPLFADAFDPAYVARHIGHHYLFLQDYVGPFMFPVFWSLGVEEKFYLLAPFLIGGLCFLVRDRRVRLGLLAVLLLIPLLARAHLTATSPRLASFLYQTFRYSWFHLRLDGLVVGVLVAFLYHHRQSRSWLASPTAPKILLRLGMLSTLALLLFLPSSPPWSDFSLVWSGTLIALAFGVLVLGAALTPNAEAGILGSGVLFFLARISYSLYLTHDLWVLPVTRLGANLLDPLGLPVGTRLGIHFAVFFVTATAAATVYYYLLEKPAILLKDRFSIARLRPVRDEPAASGSGDGEREQVHP